MIRYLNNGPEITIEDPLREGCVVSYPNPDWKGMPEIISFTDFLRWNYTEDYGKYIRTKHRARELPLPYGVSWKNEVINVTIQYGRYDRIDSDAFVMYIICEVCFDCNGYPFCQQYCVSGYLKTNGKGVFCDNAELFTGERIRCNMPLDDFLIPVMPKRKFDDIAREILDTYYPDEGSFFCRISGRKLANAMGYTVIYKGLSLGGKIKSKLIFDSKEVTVYDSDGTAVSMIVPSNTILVDVSVKDDEKEDNVIIHECVHIYLHHIFYSLQSFYRRFIGCEMPDFQDYFYSYEQQECVRWMETQANTIARHIQMPQDITTDHIIDFIDQYDGNLSFDDYRELIDFIKYKFGVSRYSAKKRIIELGWKEVRGVYTYCTGGYVQDHEIEDSLPLGYTYTLPLKCISGIFGESNEFLNLVKSGHYIYIDGHMCRNDDKYIIKDNGSSFGLTSYARHHMAECCISFRRVYEKQTYSYTYGELNKEALSAIVAYTLDEKQKKKLRKQIAERNYEYKVLDNLRSSDLFGSAVRFHMKRRGITVEEISARSGLGFSTISRMRNGGKVKIETILAFCVALELDKSYMYDLMKKANVQFETKNKVHNMYQAILELLPGANVFQINQFLIEEGMTPWTQERDKRGTGMAG